MCAAPVKNACAVCSAPATHRCANCRTAGYCGRAHQRAHWKDGHKAACHPYAVIECPELGRHWVATRDIAAGEVLLEERPLAVGPKAGSPAVCLACYAPSARAACSACGWPVCGPQCETAPVHRDAECPLIAGHYDHHRHRTAAYCFVLPLRCMLLTGADTAAFRSLQSHLDARLDTPLYRAYAVNVAEFVLDQLGLRSIDSDGVKHDERSALGAAAILDTNAFEVRRPGGRTFRAVYTRASIMAHSCTPNTKHVFFGDPANGQPSIRVVATMPISRGQSVTATYTQTLWCTRDRRRHLLAAKCFECTCPRCTDPAELGTHLGSVACRTCGALGPATTAADVCQCANRSQCSTDRDVADAERTVRSFDKTDCTGFERFLEKSVTGAMRPLHSNHYITVAVKYALTQLYSDRISGSNHSLLVYEPYMCTYTYKWTKKKKMSTTYKLTHKV